MAGVAGLTTPARRNGQDERMRIVRWFAGGRPSRIYLALVALATVLALWDLLAWAERDAYVAGTYPMFATAPALFLTAPTSVLLEWWLLPADWGGLWSFIGPVLVGALVNIAVLRGIRASAHRRRPRAAGLPGHSPESQRPDSR
jgi:hypothetical protein